MIARRFVTQHLGLRLRIRRQNSFSRKSWPALALTLILALPNASGVMIAAQAGKPKAPPGPFESTACSDRVCSEVRKQFWDPNFNGVDWDEAEKRYRPRALAAPDHERFAAVVNEMLAELRTSHTLVSRKMPGTMKIGGSRTSIQRVTGRVRITHRSIVWLLRRVLVAFCFEGVYNKTLAPMK